MKRFLVHFAVVALFAAPAFAASVVTSKHDLRATGGGTPVGTGLTEVCVVCHTPHQAVAANAQDPLWNHMGTATTAFGVYASSTLDAAPTNIGGAAMGSQSVSMLCMSCHDGTVSVISMYNNPNAGTPALVVGGLGNIDASGFITGNANVGTNLSNDHPVNFAYTPVLAGTDGGLVDPAGSPTITSWLSGGTVQCSSCHDVHDPANVPFLRISNADSALCTTCHIK